MCKLHSVWPLMVLLYSLNHQYTCLPSKCTITGWTNQITLLHKLQDAFPGIVPVLRSPTINPMSVNIYNLKNVISFYVHLPRQKIVEI